MARKLILGAIRSKLQFDGKLIAAFFRYGKLLFQKIEKDLQQKVYRGKKFFQQLKHSIWCR